MPRIDTQSLKGKGSAIELPKYFSQKPNLALIAQAFRVYEDRRHFGLAKVKTRGEVQASTRKIYRQKGTGNARHGAISAPIFVGGGVSHGPKGVKRTLKLSKNIRIRAFESALAYKFGDKKLAVLDSLNEVKKTKDAANFINKIGSELGEKKKFSLLLLLSQENLAVKRMFTNIDRVNVKTFKNANAYDVLSPRIVLLDKVALTEVKKTQVKSTVEEKANVRKVKAPAKATKPRVSVKRNLKKVKSKK